MALGVTVAQFEDHMYNHQAKAVVEVVEKPKSREFFLKQLNNMNDSLQDYLDALVEKDIESKDIRGVTTLTKEIRETLRLLAEVSGVSGRMTEDMYLAKVESMRSDYQMLVTLILTNSCPECQQKMIALLEARKLE